MMYYDKEGNPITDVLEWAKLLENKEYKIIKQEILWWRGWLSTVWLGMDHSWGQGKPLIFESVLFFFCGGSVLDCRRYSTLEEAIQGHDFLRKYWSNPLRVVSVLVKIMVGKIKGVILDGRRKLFKR